MNLKPTFLYRLRDGFIGAVSFLGVLAIVMALMITVAYSNGGDGQMTLTAVCMCAAIFFLVWGICSIREDLRLGLQYGVSRHTIFIANLLAALVLSLLVSAAGELLTGLGQLATANLQNLYVSDGYQELFLHYAGVLSFSQHLESMIFCMTVQMLCYGVGMILSMVFLRLNKLWTVIVAILLGVLLIFPMPFMAWRLAPQLALLSQWVLSGLGNWAIMTLAASAALLAGSFLLLRRAPLKTSK